MNEKRRKIFKKRYVMDFDKLLFVKDNTIWRICIICLAIILSLVALIHYQHRLNHVHKSKIQEHYETIIKLQDSISEQKYIENELSLYMEIGMVMTMEKCEPCTKENVCKYIDYLHEMGILWYPDIIKANCKAETSFGSAGVGVKYNNLFGMDHPSVRKTLSMYRSRGRFATFKNWKCSVLDRVLWDYHMFKGKKPTRNEYKSQLNKTYNTVNQDYGKTITNCIE